MGTGWSISAKSGMFLSSAFFISVVCVVRKLLLPICGDERNNIMQKWEYLTMQLEYPGGRATARSVNGQELRDWKKTPLYVLMNQLGADGWEFVSAIGYHVSNGTNGLLGPPTK